MYEYQLLGLPTDKSYSRAKKDLRRRGFGRRIYEEEVFGSVLSFGKARSLVKPFVDALSLISVMTT